MEPLEEDPGPWPRRAAALGAGALLAVAFSLAGSAIHGGSDSGLPPAGDPAWWVADRDADALYALDRERILALRVPIPRPIEIRSTADGGAWVVRSTAATARGGRTLVRIRSDGTIGGEVPVGGHPELAVRGADAIVIEDGDRAEEPRRLLTFDVDGRRRVLLEEAGLACAIGSGPYVFAGSSGGAVLRIDVENETWGIRRVLLEGPIVALAAAGSGSVYALHGGDEVLLDRLEPDLSIAWSVPCASRRAGLASTPDEQHAWIVEPDAQLLRKFDRAGELEIERAVPPTSGISAWCASEEGGIVLATPGALLVFDEKGNARAGQGGFVFLAGVDRIAAR